MTNPNDPGFTEREAADLGDIWDGADRGDPDDALDRRLREITGEVTALNAPDRAFEQVWTRGRRRRRRTRWMVASAGTLTCAMVLGVGVGVGLRPHQQPMPTALGQTSPPAADGSPVPAPTSAGPDTSAATGTLASASPSPSTPSASAGTSASGSTQRCHTTDLNPSVSIVSGSQGMGHEELNLTLTNTSGHTCTVYGYPGMALEDADLANQATTVVRTPSAGGPRLVALIEGASASTTIDFDLDIPGTGEPQTGACEPESYNLEITPPDETTQLVAPITGGPVTVCQHGTLNVYPFVAGRIGSNQ